MNLINKLVVNKITNELGVIVDAPEFPQADGRFMVDVRYVTGIEELTPFPLLTIVGGSEVKSLFGKLSRPQEKLILNRTRSFTANQYGHVDN